MVAKMRIRPEMTLGELAIQYPSTIPWLLKNQWDFCCGGAHDIKWACQVHDWEFDDFFVTIQKEIRAATSPSESLTRTWEPNQIAELLDHIVQNFHEPHREEFKQLRPLMSKAISVHSETHPFLNDLGDAVSDLIADLEPHMQKEENVLFPTIRSYCPDGAEAQQPLLGRQQSLMAMSAMRSEHETAGLLIEKIRWLTNDFTLPESACMTLELLYQKLEAFHRDLQIHIHLENNVLFPLFENMELSMS